MQVQRDTLPFGCTAQTLATARVPHFDLLTTAARVISVFCTLTSAQPFSIASSLRQLLRPSGHEGIPQVVRIVLRGYELTSEQARRRLRLRRLPARPSRRQHGTLAARLAAQAAMKVKAINRSEEACTRERSSDLRKVQRWRASCKCWLLEWLTIATFARHFTART